MVQTPDSTILWSQAGQTQLKKKKEEFVAHLTENGMAGSGRFTGTSSQSDSQWHHQRNLLFPCAYTMLLLAQCGPLLLSEL